jgi:hypothetical protein
VRDGDFCKCNRSAKGPETFAIKHWNVKRADGRRRKGNDIVKVL